MMNAFEVLAEPNRRRILDVLRASEQPVGTIVDQLGLPQPTVSKHLKMLRGAGLVTARVDGPRRFYRISSEPLRELDAWLEPYRRMWTLSLDKLEHHLDARAKDESTRRRDP